MAARRDRTPPYEIMSTVGRAAGGETGSAVPRAAREDEPAEAPAPASSSASGSEGAWWSWSGVGVPIILRVPRGVAILAVVGLIGLLVLAYWVGHTRGESAAIATFEEQTRQTAQADGRTAPDRSPGQQSGRSQQASTGGSGGTGDAGQPGGANTGASAGGDGREVGLNYFIVQTYTREHAERCAEFLAARGVETYLEPVDNDQFAIWVVEQGFTAKQLYDSQVYEQWESRLRELGRAWAEHNGNPLDTFGSMYPRKYKGG